MVSISKDPYSKCAGLPLPPCLLLLLGDGRGEGTHIETNLQTIIASEPFDSPAIQSVTPASITESSVAPVKAPGNTTLTQSKTEPPTLAYLEGIFNFFAQAITSASDYANTHLFSPDETWADIT